MEVLFLKAVQESASLSLYLVRLFFFQGILGKTKYMKSQQALLEVNIRNLKYILLMC